MKKTLILLLIFVSFRGIGQTVLENNPTGLKWRQVNSPNFRVIFPEGFESQGQRVVNTLEHIRVAESQTIGKAPRRISVILQNQSAVSNGFVSMYPRRSEFYTMPSQNYNFVGTNDWLDLLSSHEFRHIAQYEHATRGFNKILYYLFGSPTFSAMAHAAAPDWFWEGDAVVTETAFTPSGRGRIPQFSLLFRTNTLEGRTFNYHKQYLRSYKHQIPDHYVLGYQMVSYLRKRTNDPDIWEKITKRSWSVPFIPFAFSNAIRNKTGLSVTRLYREMAADLKVQWKKEVDSLHLTPFEIVNTRNSKAYTDYLYPQALSNGGVLALKQGIGDIQQFILIDGDHQKKVFTPGFINDSGMLSTAGDVVVWNEYGYDPRWQVRNYSLIKAYDWKHGERIVVSDKDSRFASAAISPDGSLIATVRTDQLYKHTLVLISYPSGTIQKEFPNPDNFFYSMPRWTNDGKKVVVLKAGDEGKSVVLIDAITGEERELIPASQENIGSPLVFNQYLIFGSPVTGIDNIFAVDLNSGKRYQVTSAKYGAYSPTVDAEGNYIYYNQQTRNGMDVIRVRMDPAQWAEFRTQDQHADPLSYLAEQEGNPEIFSNVPQKEYPVTKYSRLKHIINPFSWGVLLQSDLSRVDVGIASQDILSTASISAGYTFDLSEETGYWRAGLSYQGLYPIIDLNYTNGDRSVQEEFTTTIKTGSETKIVTNTYDLTWKEETVNAGIRIPLVLTRSKYASGIEGGYYVGVTKVTDFNNGYDSSRFFPSLIVDGEVREGYFLIDYVTNGDLIYNFASLSGYHLLKQSKRDIFSKWGQTFRLNYYGTPFGGDFEGGLYSAIGYLYFPGFFKHHSINGHVAYQKTDLPEGLQADNYLFRSTVPEPRGLGDYVPRFRDYLSASINYTFPLWYPDIALGPIVNIQRVRVNLFTDYAVGESSVFQNADGDYLSVGGEVKFDFNIFRFLPQLDLGFRYSYGIDPSVTNFELLIGTFNF